MATSDPDLGFLGTSRFEIVRRLGAGGMGVVYEAYDRVRGQSVALKTLQHVSADAIFRFKREFRSLAEIVHSNLVPLYELFFENEQWFFTMELIDDGEPFLSRIQPLTSIPHSADSSSKQTLRPGSSTSVVGADSATLAGELPANPRNPAGPTSDGTLSSVENLVTLASPVGAEESGWISRRAKPPAIPANFNLTLADEIKRAFQQLAEGVCALHAVNKLHRDLKPGNVMIRSNGRVVILDFGLVLERDSLLARKPRQDSPSSARKSYDTDTRLAGTVAYMSPEQAAGGELSEASDWYAVGVMLFEALSGHLPFEGLTSQVLLAKQKEDAPSLADYVVGVPAELSQLCDDLLQRDPKRRPTGAEVLHRLASQAEVTPSASEHAPQQDPFVGRQDYLDQLLSQFDAMLEGRTSVLHLHARSGMGKTALLEHFLTQLVEARKSLVFRGRCYEQESVPYKALDSLIDALAVFLCRLPGKAVQQLVPPDIGALVRVFPVLTRSPIVQEIAQSEGTSTNLSELRQRAFGALREMLVRIGERFSLVLCIDDLQWGDTDSVALLRQLLSGDRPPRLLLLLSYRTEYAASSSCIRALDALSSPSITVTRVEVGPLTSGETRQLVEQLSSERGLAFNQADADWVQQQSQGNPYLVHELLRFRLSGEMASTTRLDLDSILWHRVQRLPADSRQLLEVVSVSSQPIRLRYAQQVADMETVPPSLIAGLRSQHLVRSTGPGLDDEIETYHDRVRESVLANLEAHVLEKHHRDLAVSLDGAGDVAPEVIAPHYELSGQPELAAGKYAAAAERAVQALAFERAEDFYRRVLQLTSSPELKEATTERLIHFYTDLARFQDAYDTGSGYLATIGMTLPGKFNPPPFLIDLAENLWRFRGRSIASITELPTSQDARVNTIVRILGAMGKAAYQIRPELCIAILVKQINLCLRAGNTPDCAVGYMAVGTIFVGGIIGRHREGFEFGKACLQLVEKYSNHRQRAEVNFVVGYFGTSWMQPSQESERLWQVARQAGLDSGDMFHTGCACCATVMSQFMRGVPLSDVLAVADDSMELLRRFSLQEPLGAIRAVRQAMVNLRGETVAAGSLNDAEFDEEQYRSELANYGSRHFAHYYWIVKMQVLFLRGQHQKAIDTLRLCEEYVGHSKGMLHSTEHIFWAALIQASGVGKLSVLQRLQRQGTVRSAQKAFAKWARDCADNFAARERILRGEVARLSNEPQLALHAYEEAIEQARRFDQVHIEALGHQLAARLLSPLDPAPAPAAAAHLQQARDLYQRWGATQYATELSLSSVPI